MSPFFLTTYVLLWALVIVLVLLVILLYRQYGLSIMGSRQRLAMIGLDVGSAAPPLTGLLANLDEPEPPLTWSEEEPAGRLGRFLLLAIATCPICQELRPVAGDIVGRWPDVEFVWIDGPDLESDSAETRPRGPAGWRVLQSPDEAAHAAMQVSVFPFAYAVDASGRVRGKGVVSDVEDIEATLARAFKRAGRVPLTDRVMAEPQNGSATPVRSRGGLVEGGRS